LIFGQFLLFSCAREISPDVYTSRQVREISTTHVGVIRNIREVRVLQGEELEENGLGLAGGGIAGGIAGNAIGRGKFVPTAAGAVLGAVAGSFVEKKLKQQSAWEYIVELDNGSLVTVVQGKEEEFGLGQPVYLIVSQSGGSRIISQ